jgi:hypothetical protein
MTVLIGWSSGPRPTLTATRTAVTHIALRTMTIF